MLTCGTEGVEKCPSTLGRHFQPGFWDDPGLDESFGVFGLEESGREERLRVDRLEDFVWRYSIPRAVLVLRCGGERERKMDKREEFRELEEPSIDSVGARVDRKDKWKLRRDPRDFDG